MALELAKRGQVLDLTKNRSDLRHLTIGLSWGKQKSKGLLGALFSGSPSKMDIDSSVVMIDNRGSAVEMVYYGHLTSKCQSIRHAGDDLTGQDKKGEKDNEEIYIDLQAVPTNIERLVFVANIYQGDSRGQHFGQVPGSYIRVLKKDNAEELIRYDLADNYDGMRGLVVAELYRRDGEWKFKATGNSTPNDSLSYLTELAK